MAVAVLWRCRKLMTGGGGTFVPWPRDGRVRVNWDGAGEESTDFQMPAFPACSASPYTQLCSGYAPGSYSPHLTTTCWVPHRYCQISPSQARPWQRAEL